MNSAQPDDYPMKWHIMAAVGAGVFLATIDGSIVNVSLPTLVRSLNTDFSVVQWVVLAYLLTISTSMLGFGRLADIVGKKSIYMAGFIIFTSGSALCGLAISAYWLIVFRIVQAIGAAMIMALGPAIVTEAFPPRERGKAMGIIGAVVSVGIVMGPALGGVIISTLSWRWIFYVNLPIGIIGTAMVIRFVPKFNPGISQRFDYLGAITLFLSLLCLLLALTFGQQEGFLTGKLYLLSGIGMGLLLFFIVIEKNTLQPMIDLKLFKNVQLSINLVTGFLSFIGLSGVLILMPFYLENILGYPIMQVGLLMGIVPVMLGIMAPVAGSLSDRLGTRLITMAGLGIMVIGFLSAATLTQQTTVWGYILRMFAVGLGIGAFISPNNSAIMGAAPRHQMGIVSGLMAITRTLGQTMGVAVMSTIWAARTIFHTGTVIQGGITVAPLHAQTLALQDTFHTAAFLSGLALLLSIRAYTRETRNRWK